MAGSSRYVDAEALIAVADLLVALAQGGSAPLLGFRRSDARLAKGRCATDSPPADGLAWVHPPRDGGDRNLLLAEAHGRLWQTITADGDERRRPSQDAMRRAAEQLAAASCRCLAGGLLEVRAVDLCPLPDHFAGGEDAETLFLGFGDLPADAQRARGVAMRRILVERSMWLAGPAPWHQRLADAA